MCRHFFAATSSAVKGSPLVLAMKRDDAKPVVDTLTLPVRLEPPYPDNDRYAYWLTLADIALARAREEQERIKEQIRPHVERYKQIRARRGRKAT
jgi:hypothetical protein